jgi:hypothetical protein
MMDPCIDCINALQEEESNSSIKRLVKKNKNKAGYTLYVRSETLREELLKQHKTTHIGEKPPSFLTSTNEFAARFPQDSRGKHQLAGFDTKSGVSCIRTDVDSGDPVSFAELKAKLVALIKVGDKGPIALTHTATLNNRASVRAVIPR